MIGARAGAGAIAPDGEAEEDRVDDHGDPGEGDAEDIGERVLEDIRTGGGGREIAERTRDIRRLAEDIGFVAQVAGIHEGDDGEDDDDEVFFLHRFFL